MYTKIYGKDKYIGNIYNGKRHGKGIYYYESGNKYEGEWVNGKKDGRGIFIWKMEINMKENIKMVLKKEKENYIGLMEILMMENG